MKILHTSDFHIGKKLYARERNEEQQAFLQELARVVQEKEIDIVLVAGDLFDNFNPTIASMRLLYDSLYKLSQSGRVPVVAIAGNHDSADRIDMPDSFARQSGIFFLGNHTSIQQPIELSPEVSLEKSAQNYLQFRFAKYDYPLQLVVTPFVNEQRLRECFDIEQRDAEFCSYVQQMWEEVLQTNASQEGVKVLMTHLFVLENEQDQRQEPEDENAINIGGLSAVYSRNIPPQVQYTALGHLHRAQRVGSRQIWYSGSPLAYSFSEDEQQKYFLIVDIEPNKEPIVSKRKVESGIAIKNLRAKGFENALELLKANRDYWVQLRVVSPSALSYEQTCELNSAHGRLIQIIPELSSQDERNETASRIIELQDKPLELFKEFYKNTHAGVEPSKELGELFCEVMNYKNETD